MAVVRRSRGDHIGQRKNIIQRGKTGLGWIKKIDRVIGRRRPIRCGAGGEIQRALEYAGRPRLLDHDESVAGWIKTQALNTDVANRGTNLD
jgi:hypothetical protein